MPVRKPSQYRPFVDRVFLPAVRTLLTVVGLFALIAATWIETSPSIDSCGFRSNMAILDVSVYRNISEHLDAPDTVTFGLWKHCFIYSRNCTCADTKLNYEVNALQVLSYAISNQSSSLNTTIPEFDYTPSYTRVVPLIMASVFGIVAILFNVWSNRQVVAYRRSWSCWINVGVDAIAVGLIALALGCTYRSYSQNIEAACQVLATRDVHCANTSVGLEVILFAIAIGCLTLACILWVSRGLQFISGDATSQQIDSFVSEKFPDDKLQGYKSFQRGRTPSPMNRRDDAVAAWQDATHAFDHETNHARHHSQGSSFLLSNFHLRPPPHIRIGEQQQVPNASHDWYHDAEAETQAAAIGHLYDDVELIPPTLPYANKRPKPVRQSSGNTFGASEMLGHSRASTASTLEDMYSVQRRHPSTDLSSFRDSRGSFCITPTQNYSPSPHGSFDSIAEYDPPSTSPTTVPTLQTPPPPTGQVLHPLNRKVIRDQRIGAYLQTRPASSSS
ncbi:uncharacterized protein BYT42DRAFT_185076 [Radiomyces spectabilis]|uniref:uncharacterized protein n=1 Tax=Radiomyces spectabilis TaxID=64574 RepID=UPI00221F2ABC|nr:uncharacterized protein BYT42DRAFT_185076 [Radiomyces spectabilis]KAI8391187.1 hypothetical protein BYT42DRAFT_185076 [Radiomyces spectabilis]